MKLISGAIFHIVGTMKMEMVKLRQTVDQTKVIDEKVQKLLLPRRTIENKLNCI